MVDEALSTTNTVQARLRALPSRVVVYLLLAAALFEGQGYEQVWTRLCAGLGALAPKTPSRAGLWQARARVGVRPLRWLFELLRGEHPPRDPQDHHGGMGTLVCAERLGGLIRAAARRRHIGLWRYLVAAGSPSSV
jgi:Insertion element 4 transposase N-terminal